MGLRVKKRGGVKIITKSPQETINLAKNISKYLKTKDVLALSGELGSGKTVFVKGIALGLGLKKEEIISPSFVLMQEYSGKIPLYHFDLYRVKDLRELLLIGYQEYLEDRGVSVIEWANRAKNLLPKEYLDINIKIRKDTTRVITLDAIGPRFKDMLKNIEK